jgi:hypothetical protein
MLPCCGRTLVGNAPKAVWLCHTSDEGKAAGKRPAVRLRKIINL